MSDHTFRVPTPLKQNTFVCNKTQSQCVLILTTNVHLFSGYFMTVFVVGPLTVTDVHRGVGVVLCKLDQKYNVSRQVKITTLPSRLP